MTRPRRDSLNPRPMPPEAWRPLLRLARLAGRPLDRFLQIEAASGIVLLLSAAFALIWANSAWAYSYLRLWQVPLAIQLGPFHFERDLAWFINDGLMGVFFFVVGLEIRQEIHHGELAEWRRAALPIAAALGGMLGPALLYLSLASAPETHSGWGVPVATDIAFAVGVLALLGKRVPAALRVLLLALAVIDDLGAIVVIALFYSSGVSLSALSIALLGLAVIFALQRLGVRRKFLYIVPALVVWGATYAAGIHPTIAAVVVGLATPVQAWLGAGGFVHFTEQELDRLKGPAVQSSQELAESLRRVDAARREALSPAQGLITALHPWVAYLIMPLFALANSGVSLSGIAFDAVSLRVMLGCGLGLLVGKPLGILLSSWLMLRFGFATLPRGLGLRQLCVLGTVAGIGFTMALFIAQLAFPDPKLLAASKLGVLVASGLAGVIGLSLGRAILPAAGSAGAAESAEAAERSSDA